jgi:hypothetical protein
MDKRILLLALPVMLAGACSSSSSSNSSGNPPVNPASPPLLGEDCDPIEPAGSAECGFPFPSNVWRAPDTKTATGFHIFFGPTTLPEYEPGMHVDATPWATKDGFSPGAAMMLFWPDISITGLADPDHIDQSITTTSPTVIMNFTTGALVPHWAEIDETGTTKDGQRAFFIHPAIRLQDATRYIVAIRNVQDSTGAVIPPSAAFQALRDNTASTDVSVGLRRDLYNNDILPTLKAHGIDPSNLQIAWDFTTASKQSTTSDMVSMRDQALALVGNDGPAYTITQVSENPNPYIRRRITGNMTVPLYLTDPAICQMGNPPFGPGCPGSSINRAADGTPAQAGTASYPFLVQIPNSIVNMGVKGAIIQNAHGLFGDLTEGQDSYMAEICDREHYVEIAVNLEGFASDDVNYVTNVISGDLGQFIHVVDRMHQGYINELLAMRMMIGKMSTEPQTMPEGKPTIDSTTRFSRGDSQGGIGGGVYMAITTDVTRGLLDNTGAPYELLLSRSSDFTPFFLVIRGIYSDPPQLHLGIDLIQQLWDNAEPDGYISYISQDMLPNTPAHNVLIHDALGDQQVTPLGAHFEARTLAAQNIQPVNRELFGLTDATGGFTGNGLAEFNFWLPASQSPLTNVPPPVDFPGCMCNAAECTSQCTPDPHDALRQLNAAQDMADQFFRTGVVNQTCTGGPCAAPMDWQTAQLLTPADEIDAGTNPDAGDGGMPPVDSGMPPGDAGSDTGSMTDAKGDAPVGDSAASD